MRTSIVALCVLSVFSSQVVSAASFENNDSDPCAVLQKMHDDSTATLAQIAQAKEDIKTVNRELDRVVSNTIGGAVIFAIPAAIMIRSVIKHGSFPVNNVFDFLGWVVAADAATAGGIAFTVYVSKIPNLKSAIKAKKAELVRAEKNYKDQEAALADAIRACSAKSNLN